MQQRINYLIIFAPELKIGGSQNKKQRKFAYDNFARLVPMYRDK